MDGSKSVFIYNPVFHPLYGDNIGKKLRNAVLQEPHQMIQVIIFQWWLLMIVNEEMQGTQCNFSIWDFEPWDSVIQSGVSLSGWFN